MEDLTFGEQVKIVLGRKGMTIKELAETIERETGKKMSRQNLTQRLGRDNFQEQDMRLIAGILGCPFQLSIMSGEIAEAAPVHAKKQKAKVQEVQKKEEKPAAETVQKQSETVNPSVERDMTIGELYDIHEELSELEKNARAGEPVEEIREELEKAEDEYKEEDAPVEVKAAEEPEAEAVQEQPESVVEEAPAEKEESQTAEYQYNQSGEADYTEAYGTAETTSDYTAAYEQPEMETSYAGDYTEAEEEPVPEQEEYEAEPAPEPEEEPQEEVGDINPYTGREYESNSVRMHPSRIGYVQVYDRSIHKWTDMTEWAFLGYQERKKVLLGSAYEPPIYLD